MTSVTILGCTLHLSGLNIQSARQNQAVVFGVFIQFAVVLYFAKCSQTQRCIGQNPKTQLEMINYPHTDYTTLSLELSFSLCFW